jgi:hypothetical protein
VSVSGLRPLPRFERPLVGERLIALKMQSFIFSNSWRPPANFPRQFLDLAFGQAFPSFHNLKRNLTFLLNFLWRKLEAL